MTGFVHDLRFAVRMLRKHKAFTLVAVVALALGIGGTTVMFAAVDSILLRPLPYPEAPRLVRLWSSWGTGGVGSVSLPDFEDWRAQSKTLELMSAISYDDFTLVKDGLGQRVVGMHVTADLFKLLGAQPRLGRDFSPDDFVHGNAVILGDELWRTRFGASPDVIGQPVRLSGTSYTVVGVLPPAARMPDQTSDVFYLPLVADAAKHPRGNHYLQVVARYAPGATPAQAKAELDAIARRLEQSYPDSNHQRGVLVRSWQESLTQHVRPALLLLLGAVLLVLLMVCANVANMLLARVASRRGELAVRLALGAGRARVVRQLMVECLLLGLAGAGAGLLLAMWGLDALRAIMPRNFIVDPRLDLRALGFAAALALGATFVFGLVPALRAVGGDLGAVLKQDARTVTGARSWLRSSLVVLQVALSFAVVVGAALLGRSFARLLSVEPGYDPRGVVTLQVSLPETKDPLVYFPRVLDEVRALPEVSDAGWVDFLPLSPSNINGDFDIEGKTFDDPNRATEYMVVTPGYFEAMRMHIVSGRGIGSGDVSDGERVCVVNQAMARRYFGTEDPVGRHMRIGWSDDKRWMTVVGVLADIKRFGLDNDAQPETYLPLSQQPFGNMALAVRAKNATATASLAEAVRRAVQAADPEQAIFDVRTMSALVDDSVRQRRLLLDFSGFFGLIALVVAALGIYGVLAVQVAQRTRELGIRMALGATPRDVRALVVRQGVTLAVAGAGLGASAALALSSLLASMLYGVTATDPATYGVVALALVAMALAASWLPARRATAIDPMVALRA